MSLNCLLGSRLHYKSTSLLASGLSSFLADFRLGPRILILSSLSIVLLAVGNLGGD